MAMRFAVTVAGAAEMTRAMSVLAPKAFRTAARAGVADAAKIVAKAAKANVAVRTGSLKKAIGWKVKALKNGTGYVGIVGVRRDSPTAIARSVVAVLAGKRKRPLKVRFRRTITYRGVAFVVNPANYAHLVEFGRRPVKPKRAKVMKDAWGVVYGRSARAAAPRPFLRPAWDGNQAACRAAVRKRFAAAARNPRGR